MSNLVFALQKELFKKANVALSFKKSLLKGLYQSIVLIFIFSSVKPFSKSVVYSFSCGVANFIQYALC